MPRPLAPPTTVTQPQVQAIADSKHCSFEEAKVIAIQRSIVLLYYSIMLGHSTEWSTKQTICNAWTGNYNEIYNSANFLIISLVLINT